MMKRTLGVLLAAAALMGCPEQDKGAKPDPSAAAKPTPPRTSAAAPPPAAPSASAGGGW